jgi:hypothetical protein
MNIDRVQQALEDLAMQTAASPRVDRRQISSAVGSQTAGLQKRLQQIYEYVFRFSEPHNTPPIDRLTQIDAGDTVITGVDGQYTIASTLPVASDIWYLGISDSVLPFRGENYQEDSTRILEIIRPMMDRLGGIKPLKSIQQYEDLSMHLDVASMRWFIETAAPYVIRETRYETWMLNRNTEYPSYGSIETSEEGKRKNPEESEGNLYCGLLSFPIGPLGVMEVLSLWSETMDSMIVNERPFAGTVPIHNPEGWMLYTDRPLDGLMSPMTDLNDQCPGVHLVERGYLIAQRDCEYPAKPVGNADDIYPFQSLRFYLHRNAVWPVPGELVVMQAKPFPTHVWWFQETSPLLYSGNWVETNHYSSGIVVEKLDPPEGSYGHAYKVNVRGVDLYLLATDFFEYEVGERVAVIRRCDLGRQTDPSKGNFKWYEMENLIEREKERQRTPDQEGVVISNNYTILPISFYQEG